MRLRRRSFSLFGLLAALPMHARAAPLPAGELRAILELAAFELYPHPALPYERYAALAASFLEREPDLAQTLARALGGATFTGAAQSERIERLRAAEGEPAFQVLRAQVQAGLYNDLTVTRQFGYQGPSLSQGGYLERGFDDATWVPVPGVDAD